MFQDILIYIQNSREARREHLDLTEPCIKIGGNSFQSRLLLAHHLKTTVSHKKHIYVCHACNDAMCSNVKHLYWGTAKDNYIDRIEAGTNRLHDSRPATSNMRAAARRTGLKHGGSNALKDEDLKRIKAVLDSIPKQWGWITKAAKQLNVSHTQIQRYLKMVGRVGIEPTASSL